MLNIGSLYGEISSCLCDVKFDNLISYIFRGSESGFGSTSTLVILFISTFSVHEPDIPSGYMHIHEDHFQ